MRRTDCPYANLVLFSLAHNVCDHLRVTITQLRTIAIPATLALDRYKKTVGSCGTLSIFLLEPCERSVREQRAWQSKFGYAGYLEEQIHVPLHMVSTIPKR